MFEVPLSKFVLSLFRRCGAGAAGVGLLCLLSVPVAQGQTLQSNEQLPNPMTPIPQDTSPSNNASPQAPEIQTDEMTKREERFSELKKAYLSADTNLSLAGKRLWQATEPKAKREAEALWKKRLTELQDATTAFLNIKREVFRQERPAPASGVLVKNPPVVPPVVPAKNVPAASVVGPTPKPSAGLIAGIILATGAVISVFIGVLIRRRRVQTPSDETIPSEAEENVAGKIFFTDKKFREQTVKKLNNLQTPAQPDQTTVEGLRDALSSLIAESKEKEEVGIEGILQECNLALLKMSRYKLSKVLKILQATVKQLNAMEERQAKSPAEVKLPDVAETINQNLKPMVAELNADLRRKDDAIAGLGREKREINANLTKANERIEELQRQEEKKTDVLLAKQKEIESLKTFVANAESELAKTERMLEELTNFEAARQALTKNLAKFPKNVHNYLGGLLELGELMKDNDLAARRGALSAQLDFGRSDEFLDKIYQFVYQLPDAFGIMAQQSRGGIAPQDVMQIIGLQSDLHKRLHDAGLIPIAPEPLMLFDRERHEASPQDFVWVGSNAANLSNKVASVKQVGFLWGGNVLRRATVKRYVLDSELKTSPMTEPAPDPEPPAPKENFSASASEVSPISPTPPALEEKIPDSLSIVGGMDDGTTNKKEKVSGEPAAVAASEATEEDLLPFAQ